MTTGTLTHRLFVVWTILALDGIEHSALSIVDRTCNHTDIRHSHIVLHHIHIRLAPLHLLQTEDSLEVDDIRVCSVKTRRLCASVEVHKQFMLCADLGSVIVEVAHRLVVTIHKVDLKALYTDL